MSEKGSRRNKIPNSFTPRMKGKRMEWKIGTADKIFYIYHKPCEKKGDCLVVTYYTDSKEFFHGPRYDRKKTLQKIIKCPTCRKSLPEEIKFQFLLLVES